MHAEIEGFHLEGEISGKGNVMQAREELIREMENNMRDEGYVRILDLEPQFTLSYLEHQEKFSFKLTMYGTWVGKEKSWLTSGVMNGKPLMRSTARRKSKPSSLNVE